MSILLLAIDIGENWRTIGTVSWFDVKTIKRFCNRQGIPRTEVMMRRCSCVSGFVLALAACAVVLIVSLFRLPSIARANSSNINYGVTRSNEPSSDIRFTSALTQFVYLPIIFTPPPAIAGHVIQNGAPLAGAQVALLSISPFFMHPQTVTTTVTDANGNYAFFNMRSTFTDTYHVEYFRAVTYGQLTWYTPPITYTAGTNYTFAPVDTTGISLISPPDGSTIKLPHTFSWTVRPGFPTDSYEVLFFWAPWSLEASGPVGYTSSAVVPLSALQGNQFPYLDWYVIIHSPIGFGQTYMRRVYFR